LIELRNKVDPFQLTFGLGLYPDTEKLARYVSMLQDLFAGRVPLDAKDQDIPEMRDIASKLYSSFNKDFPDRNRTVYVQNCGPGATLMRVFGENPGLTRAWAPPPLPAS